MSILEAYEIQDKDFSRAIPAITNQLNFLVNTIRNSAFSDNNLEPEALHGLAFILEDIGSDLEKIDNALYPVKDQMETQGKTA
jgi:hypothetical protein